MMQIALHLIGLAIIYGVLIWSLAVTNARKGLSVDNPLRKQPKGLVFLLTLIAVLLSLAPMALGCHSYDLAVFLYVSPWAIAATLYAPIGTRARLILGCSLSVLYLVLLWHIINIGSMSGGELAIRRPYGNNANVSALAAKAQFELRKLRSTQKLILLNGWVDQEPNLGRLNPELRRYIESLPQKMMIYEERWFTPLTGIEQGTERKIGLYTQGGSIGRALFLLEIRVR